MEQGRILILAALLAAPGTPSWGGEAKHDNGAGAVPAELSGVGIDQRLGNRVPLDLPFRDQDGRVVRLGDCFQRGRPVLLTLNYSNCPMLCSVQLNGLVDALKQLSFTPGEEFEIVTVSIDPLEQPARARLTKEKYIGELERPAAAKGWQFLVGGEPNIRALADAVGFGYRYNPARKEYLHAAAAMVLSPDGVVTRYLLGVRYDPKALRLSLVEASEGKVGTASDDFLLFCFHYDSATGRYAPSALKIMRLGGVVTALILGAVLLVLWRREARRRLAVEAAT
jgi:protein SCO1/2